MNPTWQSDDGSIQLYCADCLAVLPTLAAGSVDAVVTDPPYGIILSGKRAKMRGGGQTTRLLTYSTAFDDTPDYIKSTVLPALAECKRIARSVALTPGIRNLWLYPPADDLGGFYSAASTGVGRWGFTCIMPILYYGKDPYLSACMGSRPNSCGQTYPNDANEQEHPCAKPIRMIRWLVERTSLPRCAVLDPFMGSGTTGVACVQTGRRFIGIEIEPKYFDIAVRRITNAQAPLPGMTETQEVQNELEA